MCGIAGIIGAPDPLVSVRRMTASLKHRGPDGEGYFTDREIGLGHRRLAILDLTPAGRQPMCSRDGRWVLALNGEIFNYRELRQELSGQWGGEFRTGTDTEVLLEACALLGVEKVLDKLNGMFAFALWDRVGRELTLARDRSGEKPLVYFWNGSTFAFASELQALRNLHDSRLDPEAVDAYLALGYVPAPLAIFHGCRKLPAGHRLRFHNGSLEVRRWWFPERVTDAPAPAGAARREELRALVAGAVRLRLRADVPVALCLSGGVDSSVVAAECVREGRRLDAFTVTFGRDSADLPYARAVARKLGLKHEVIAAPADTAERQLEAAIQHYDEPFADSSALPALALARVLGGRYKVILNGDGGDEAFAGYRHYEHIGAKQFLKTAAAAAGLRDGSGSVGVYVQSKTTFRFAERSRLLGWKGPGDTLSALLAGDHYLRGASTAASGALGRALWSDRHLYLPNDLTYKMDIALAAFGMEGRAPFLDYRVLEWSQGLAARDLVRGREKKVLLRESYRGELPAEVLDRPKHGFGAPVDAWLAGPLQELRRDSLPCPLLDAGLQKSARGQRLWTLLKLARWARVWKATW